LLSHDGLLGHDFALFFWGQPEFDLLCGGPMRASYQNCENEPWKAQPTFNNNRPFGEVPVATEIGERGLEASSDPLARAPADFTREKNQQIHCEFTPL
jgi:hypothetical protein